MCALYWSIRRFCADAARLPFNTSIAICCLASDEVALPRGSSFVCRFQFDVFGDLGEHAHFAIADGTSAWRGDGFLHSSWDSGIGHTSWKG